MSDQTTLPEAAPAGGHQMFRLVDAEKLGTSGGACGCGGHGQRTAPGADTAVQEKASGGCGCGGHGHAAASGQNDEGGTATTGGCGCGGHGHGSHHQGDAHAKSGSAGPVSAAAEELVLHSIPRVVRKAVIFTAVDQLPLGEAIILVAPHQPEPLFEHLRSSQAHYRVETLGAGPEQWRYRVTRLA